MKADSCFELGHVLKPHGIKGELLIFLDVDDPSRYEGLESFFISIEGKLVPFFIKTFKLQGVNAIVKLEDVDDIDQAKELVSGKIFLPLDLLPDLGDNEFYFHEIIGFSIIDTVSGRLGVIKQIYETSGNNLAGMEYKDKEVLVPLNHDFIDHIDKKNKELHMKLPDGLLDL